MSVNQAISGQPDLIIVTNPDFQWYGLPPVCSNEPSGELTRQTGLFAFCDVASVTSDCLYSLSHYDTLCFNCTLHFKFVSKVTCDVGDHYKQTDSGLQIFDVTKSDEGEYTCRAEVEVDGRYDEHRITVNVHSKQFFFLILKYWNRCEN